MVELADAQTVSIRFDALHFSEAALTLQLALFPVSAEFGVIKGSGGISRSLMPSEPPVQLPQVTGMYQTGPDNKLQLHVSGEYLQSAPPPARGTFLGQFSASCTVDADWSGRGYFIYGRWEVGPCVVTDIGLKAGDAPAIMMTNRT
ncbi:MAG TPA: hypothetical protein VF605_07635 [Allosphingosinicella sp.]|jgi:hypothetical protein